MDPPAAPPPCIQCGFCNLVTYNHPVLDELAYLRHCNANGNDVLAATSAHCEELQKENQAYAARIASLEESETLRKESEEKECEESARRAAAEEEEAAKEEAARRAEAEDKERQREARRKAEVEAEAAARKKAAAERSASRDQLAICKRQAVEDARASSELLGSMTQAVARLTRERDELLRVRASLHATRLHDRQCRLARLVLRSFRTSALAGAFAKMAALPSRSQAASPGGDASRKKKRRKKRVAAPSPALSKDSDDMLLLNRAIEQTTVERANKFFEVQNELEGVKSMLRDAEKKASRNETLAKQTILERNNAQRRYEEALRQCDKLVNARDGDGSESLGEKLRLVQEVASHQHKRIDEFERRWFTFLTAACRRVANMHHCLLSNKEVNVYIEEHLTTLPPELRRRFTSMSRLMSAYTTMQTVKTLDGEGDDELFVLSEIGDQSILDFMDLENLNRLSNVLVECDYTANKVALRTKAKRKISDAMERRRKIREKEAQQEDAEVGCRPRVYFPDSGKFSYTPGADALDLKTSTAR